MFIEELSIMLCPSLDGNSFFPEDRYIERLLSSDSSLSGREVYLVVEILPITNETGLTIGNLEGDIEITIAISSHMSLSADLDTHATLDTCWDVDIFLYQCFLESLSMTDMTLLRDDLSRSTTVRTGDGLFHDAENRLHSLTYLTISMTRNTGLDRISILGSIASTARTS